MTETVIVKSWSSQKAAYDSGADVVDVAVISDVNVLFAAIDDTGMFLLLVAYDTVSDYIYLQVYFVRGNQSAYPCWS